MIIAGPYLESASNLERMRKDPIEERVEPFEQTRIPVSSPEEARRIVAQLANRNFDFLKIRTIQNIETYLALNEAANSYGIPVVGHVNGIKPEVLLNAGQDSVEHSFFQSLDDKTSEERIALWRKFSERGVPIVPTLVTLFHSIFPSDEYLRSVTNDEEGKVDFRRKYLSKYLILDWREQVLETNDQRRQALQNVWEKIIKRDLLEMRTAGMDILIGTDVAVLNIYPGFSVHDEMELFVSKLGMKPLEVLQSATIRSAKFLRIGDLVGTVEPGKLAELVLLDANPLQDIRNTRRISAVIVQGKLFDKKGIDKLLTNVQAARDRRIDDWGRKAKKKKAK